VPWDFEAEPEFQEKLDWMRSFIDAELKDPILRGIDKNDPVARNPCLRRGPLSLDYWTRLTGNSWRSLRKLAGAD
jgi:hypothetical protein